MKRAMHAGKSFFAPTTLTAIIAIAISFTFLSCSGDDGGGDGDSSSSSAGKSSSSTAALACGEWETKTPATCESAGSKTRSCDGDSTETEALSKLDWNGWETITPATCESAGERSRTCPGNASPAQTEAIPKLGWKQTKAPTCEAAGEEESCSSPGTKRSIPKLEWSERTKVEPTCFEAGVMTRTCGGQTEDDSIDKLPSSDPSCQFPISDYVRIGSQVWMSKNLDRYVPGSACYDDDPDNCAKYGRLYDWAAAMAACPDSWHIPTYDEWDELARFIEEDQGCSGCDALHLKARSGWNYSKGLDSYGFAALPGGDGEGYWWSASESGSGSNAFSRIMDDYEDYEDAFWEQGEKTKLLNVRCLQD